MGVVGFPARKLPAPSEVSPLWGAGIGAIWVVGRIVYAWGYYQADEKRAIGFGINSLSGAVLLLGSLVGIVLSLVRS